MRDAYHAPLTPFVVCTGTIRHPDPHFIPLPSCHDISAALSCLRAVDMTLRVTVLKDAVIPKISDMPPLFRSKNPYVLSNDSGVRCDIQMVCHPLIPQIRL